jgi:RimJ/RimL family protein N-acetyltransferase
MEKVSLRMATKEDESLVVAFDYLNRKKKIVKAISGKECFIIYNGSKAVGFVIFDYRFFDNGWIELIIIDEKYRGMGIGGKVFGLICKQCKVDKVFTSTNSSNLSMQKALAKAGFSFSGKLDGLDEGDPELVYYKFCMHHKGNAD